MSTQGRLRGAVAGELGQMEMGPTVMDATIETLQSIGPLLACVWLLTICLTIFRPQRFRNSFLLMFALVVTMIFIAGCLGNAGPTFLLVSFLLVMLALFMVPVLLVIHGFQMIRRESFCLAHCLSLGLGLFVGAGEVAAIVYVLGLDGEAAYGTAGPWLMLLVFTVFYFSSLVLAFVMYTIFIQVLPHRWNFDYVIIHGCGLLGGERLTKLLSNRVDKAIDIYRRCRRKPTIIPSGGQGPDEKLSEAEAMGKYLLDHGVPRDSIVLEDQSATTRENLLNSKAIIDARGGGRTALVSSNYHVYRCLRFAREVGLSCTGVGAKTALYYWPSALIREFIAVFLTRGFLVRALLGYVLFISPLLYALLKG